MTKECPLIEASLPSSQNYCLSSVPLLLTTPSEPVCCAVPQASLKKPPLVGVPCQTQRPSPRAASMPRVPLCPSTVEQQENAGRGAVPLPQNILGPWSWGLVFGPLGKGCLVGINLSQDLRRVSGQCKHGSM